jgi:hypothetical protein
MSYRKRHAFFDPDTIQQLERWADIIVRNDPSFQDYAGAPIAIGEELATIDIGLYLFTKNPKLTLLMKLRRKYLSQLRTAYFAGERASELTMLNFLKGIRESHDARGLRPTTTTT